ncbi:pyridoxal phosphate-dependent decarboxylase family protein [Actinocrispum wychmicini]|uniref:Glutamate/tyrosine decarboxylase-like PLP-dependent enzyme n=1 Tax=Actinocrispum wychmicini TaxID=1213861 RepID=A0A4R2JAF0_9PSEU|nr:pyridoxal-dependent decarboxylase [Actinocrispum wychmicini]TCO52929.1 glutamate/tyrosine decarboxylase-like PLP-dependent enzyme [Actinocrispum wychmicini]
MDDLLADAAVRGRRYVRDVGDRAVAPLPAAVADLAKFDEPLPEHPGDPGETLALLDEVGSPATVANTGPRYFGFVTGGTEPAALAAGWLGLAWDQNSALPVMSPVAARLHAVTTRWLVDLLGLPDTSQVSYVTGATMANATALTAARDRQLRRAGWDAQADGLFGAPPVTVVAGEQAHSTLIKALGLIGLGRGRVHRVPADDQGRMLVGQLPDVRGPVIVCAQAGEVNTGAFDRFPAIVEWARERAAWLHVDSAFGLWALADPGLKHLTEGLTEFDSWATDAHKWLNVSYDSGLVIVRDPANLRRSFASTADYLPPDDVFEPMHHTPQSSQRARQIEVWAVLRTLGRSGVAELVANGCRHARRIAGLLVAGGLRVLNDVVLNQVVVVAEDDEATARLIRAVQADGTCWCGPTTWQGRHAMRISVAGWNTTDADIDRSAEAILRCAEFIGDANASHWPSVAGDDDPV